MEREPVAVVTGASAGMGEAIARRLLDAGRTVVTMQRNAPTIDHPAVQSISRRDPARAAALRIAVLAGPDGQPVKFTAASY